MRGFEKWLLDVAGVVYGTMVPVLMFAAGFYLSPSDTASAREPARIGGHHFPSPHDRLCLPAEIFSAEILSASLSDCQLKGPFFPPFDPANLPCDLTSDLTFGIRVVEAIGLNAQAFEHLRIKPLQQNNVIDVFVKINNRPPGYFGGQADEDEFGFLKIGPPADGPLSARQISDRFVGQRFIFGIRRNPFDKADLPAAIVWTTRVRPWVEDNLRNSMGACPKLIQHVDSP